VSEGRDVMNDPREAVVHNPERTIRSQLQQKRE
jgi:hypothetical protein